ncbi:MAG: hypothetical protein RMM58_07345 [Chloroflexota bacterium]|nr:hypothetical protein [Dehalococcoidia bacterium]MDW8253674.1 hypothetical protein [Chloroflexota bacterium]
MSDQSRGQRVQPGADQPRAVAEALVRAIEREVEARQLRGRWEMIFPAGSSDFELRGEGLRVIVEVNRGFERTGLARRLARLFRRGPIQARLRAWFLNEFVERLFPQPADAIPVIFSLLEAHRPAGLGLPSAVSGAPERDSPDRPSIGADD